MKKKLIVFFLAFFIILPLLFSEEVENKILTALDQLKKGKSDEAVEFLAEAIMLINNKKDLKIKKIVLCSAIREFRDYTEKDTDILKVGEPLLVYIEPEGYRVVKEDGLYKIQVSEDVLITDEKGKVVFEKTDWVVYEKGFDIPVIPFYITNRITDIPAGKYTYSLTVKDHYKKSFIKETFEFSVE